MIAQIVAIVYLCCMVGFYSAIITAPGHSLKGWLPVLAIVAWNVAGAYLAMRVLL